MGWTWPVDERAGQTGPVELALARELEVAEGVLCCLRPLLEPAAGGRDLGKRAPNAPNTGVVLFLVEKRQRRPCKSLKLVYRNVARENDAPLSRDDESKCLSNPVSGLTSPLRRGLGHFQLRA
jgi:hypothetical protein